MVDSVLSSLIVSYYEGLTEWPIRHVKTIVQDVVSEDLWSQLCRRFMDITRLACCVVCAMSYY